MKKISLIIITYNRTDDTLELLQNISLLQNTSTLLEDVIIVNNASTSDYSKVEQFTNETVGTPFRYIASATNLGVAKGRNYAAQFAKGDLLVFFDDDIVIEDKDILQKIVASFNIQPYKKRQLGVVSFKVRYHSNRQMQINAFPHKNFKEYRDKASFATYYYAGCAHAFRKEAWLGYPEDFFYGMEEYDQGYRVLDLGFAIGYDASVEILHKESPLGRKPKNEQFRMMWVNKTKVAWKYLPLQSFFTTALLWSIEYLRKTGFALNDYFKAWRTIAAIPFGEKRTKLKKETMVYLKAVKARISY